MVKNNAYDIKIRQYTQGRISISGKRSLIDQIDRWARSYAEEFSDPAAIEMVQSYAKYLEQIRLKEAKRIWKTIKSGLRTRPLTEKEKRIVSNSRYFPLLRERGWI